MSQRKDTCHGKKCPFWKRYGEFCPNYVEGKWETPEGHEYETKDCAPKRAMILSQQLYDQLICTRKDYNEMRNATVKILSLTAQANGIELITEGEVVDAPKQIEEG
jgi:hypothetical protein